MIDENFQAIRRAICAGCLNQDRKLCPIKELKKYAFFCYALKFDDKDWVCWECKQMVIKLAAFRSQVTKSQDSLANLLSGRPSQMKCHSKLSETIITEYVENENVYGEVEALDPLYYQLVKDTVQSEDDGSGNDESLDYKDSVCIEESHLEDDDEAIGDDETAGDDVKRDGEAMGEEDADDHEKPIQVTNVIKKAVPKVAKKRLRADGQISSSNIGTVSTVQLSLNEEDIPLAEPELKIEKNARSVVQMSNTEEEENVTQDTLVQIENPFTVHTISQVELIMWRLRKRTMEFYSSSSPLQRCEDCIEPFDSQRLYTAHMKGHTMDFGDESCDICELHFGDEEELLIHKERHNRLLKCKHCEFQWDSYNGMRRHCQTAHEIPIAAWICDHCNREYAEVAKLQRHRMRHQVRKCPECGVALRSDVRKHMLRAHKTLPVLTCDQCGLKCKGNSGLQDHVKSCRMVGEQTYCVECDIDFKNKYRYRAHFKNTLKHASDEQLRFRCTECGKGCLDAASLMNHVDAVHEKRQKYLCETCGKGFFTMLSRKKHMRRVHSGRPVRKDHVCSYCGKTFERKRQLLEHTNKHTGARPYICECGASFGFNCALSKHKLLKHTRSLNSDRVFATTARRILRKK